MEQIILEIKNQIYETIILCKNFFNGFDMKILIVSIAGFYFIFMRKWEIKKVFSCIFTMLLFFIILVRIEAYLQQTFGAEGSNIAIGIGRIIFLIIAAVVYIYRAAIKD